MLSVYATAAREPNFKEFLHAFEELHAIGAVVFGCCHSSEALKSYSQNRVACEDKPGTSFSSLCFAPKARQTDLSRTELCFNTERTSERAIILAVLSVLLSPYRAQSGAFCLSPTPSRDVLF